VIQSESETAVILQTEIVLMIFDGVYVVCSVLYLILAALQNDGVNSRRLGFFSFAALATSAVTILTQIVFVVLNKYMYSVMPSMLFCSIHITVASMCLFLLHCGGGPEYVEMDTKDDLGPGTMDVEVRSDDEDDGGDDDDEEEDGEEE
jgi:hypothetical protein